MTEPEPHDPIPAPALAYLSDADPVLAGIIERVGEIEVPREPDLWWSLVDAIVSQQLSVAAAATIVGRLRALGPPEAPPLPQVLIAAPDDDLRALGLSRAKVSYVKDLAAKWLDSTLQPERIPTLPDEDVIAHLVQVKGIGRWTAEMALIFCLGRPDVLPVDDLGLQVAVQNAYGQPERPRRDRIAALGEAWRPFRTAASLYLWRSRRLG
jgi:3-methyladenine DNA glycosylase/8-oxoguanine DNA glycosylase